MNFLGLTRRSVLRKPVKSILLLIVVFVISTLLLAGMSSRNASIEVQDKTRQAIGAGFLLEKNDEYRAKRIEELSKEIGDKDGELDGYLIYWVGDEIFHIKDMIFLNEEARIGLWNFVGAHFSMISKVIGNTFTDEPLAFLFEDAKIQETISPYYMARIVDFEGFISQFPFKPDNMERKWAFTLKDPMLPWNQGAFELTIDNQGKATVGRLSKKTRDSVDIQTMTTMLLGYKSPYYLHKIGRLECSEETVNMLEDAVEQITPYFSDTHYITRTFQTCWPERTI